MIQRIEPAAKAGGEVPRQTRSLPPILTTRQRLEGIEQLRQRVNTHAEFMGGVESLRGSSTEAKDAAVQAFYERLAELERQLGRIAEGLRLG